MTRTLAAALAVVVLLAATSTSFAQVPTTNMPGTEEAPETTVPPTTTVPTTTTPAPIDCVVSDFYAASFCSATCGNGTQEYLRDIVTPPAFGGMECPHLNETRWCNLGPCPIHCQVSNWTIDTECTVTCGGGTRNRSRTIVVQPMFGGDDCPHLFDMIECNTRDCPRPTVLTDDGNLVMRYAFGKDVMFEELPGLYPDTMPGSTLRVTEIQTIEDYQNTRAADLSSIETTMSMDAATASTHLSVTESTLVATTSRDADMLENRLSTETSSVQAELASAIMTASNSLESALDTRTSALSRETSMAVAAERAERVSAVASLSTGVASAINTAKTQATNAAVASANAYTDDVADATLASATTFATNAAQSAQTASSGYTNTAVQNAQNTLTSAINNARTYASTLAAQTLQQATANVQSVADTAQANAINAAYAYTNNCLRMCPAGQYISRTCTTSSANVCSNCAAYYHSPFTSLDRACYRCQPTTCGRGTYISSCSRTSTTGANSCINCPSNQYQDASSHASTSCKTCSCPSGYRLYACDRNSGPLCYYYGIGVIGYNGCGEWYYGGQRLTGCTGAGNWGNGINVWVERGCCISDHYDQYAYSTVRITAGRFRFYCAADDCCNIYVSGPRTFYPINHGCGGCTSCGGHNHYHDLPTGQYTFRYYMHEYGGGDWWRFGFYRA